MRKILELENPQSCLNRAKNHEWLFVLLERDEAAPIAIRAWVQARIRLFKNKPDDLQIKEALACAEEMETRFICHRCSWKGPFIKANPDPSEPPRCPVCG